MRKIALVSFIMLLCSCNLMAQINVQYRISGLYANVTDWDDHRWNFTGWVQDNNAWSSQRSLMVGCVKTTGGRGWMGANIFLGFSTDDNLSETGVRFYCDAFVKRCKAGNGAAGNGDDCAYKDICYCGRLGTRCSSDDDGYRDNLGPKTDSSFLYYRYEPGKWHTTSGDDGQLVITGWGYKAKIDLFWTPPTPDPIVFSQSGFNVCGGSTYTLSTGWSWGNGRGYNNASYVWQESTDNINWVTIPSQTGSTLTLTAPTNAPVNGSLARFYRVFMVYNGTQSLSPKVLSNTVYIYPPPPSSANISVTESSCYGFVDGKLQINSVTGGAGIYKYNIAGPSGLVFNSVKTGFPVKFPVDASDPLNMTGLPSGNYAIQIENNRGIDIPQCYYTQTITINQPAPLTIQYVTQNYNGYGVSCNGSSNGVVTLSATGGNSPYSLLLDDNAGLTSPFPVDISGIYSSLSAGTYYAKVVDRNSCPNTIVPITITQPAILSSAPQVTNVRCFGNNDGIVGFNTAGGVAPYSYSTNGGQSFAGVNPVPGLSPGTYQTITKDLNGCTVSSIVSITEPSQLTISATNVFDILCNGSATGSFQGTATGGISPYTFKINTGLYQANNGFTNLTAGNYALYAKDNNGCIANVNVNISEPTAIQNIALITNVTCFGRSDGSILNTISGGVAPYTYSWVGRADQTSSISNLSSGSYTLKVRDAHNCLYQETQSVSAPASQLVVSNVTPSPASCNSFCDGAISLIVNGGVPPYQYDFGSGYVSSASVTNICSGNVNISIKDSYGCMINERVDVSLTNDISVNIPDQLLLCVGQHYPVDVSDPSLNVQWTSDNGFTSSAHAVDLVDPDTYYLNISNVSGCYYKDTVVLQTSLDLLQARFFLPSSVALGDTVSFVEASWPRPDSVRWDFGYNAAQIPNDEGFTELVYDQPGTYTVKMTAYLGQCRDSVSKTITFYVSSPYVADSTDLGYVGIKDFRLYPNPNNGTFTLDVWLDESSDLLATITNQYGNSVYTMPMGNGDTFSQSFSLPVLGSGVYALRLEALGDVKVIKFIVY